MRSFVTLSMLLLYACTGNRTPITSFKMNGVVIIDTVENASLYLDKHTTYSDYAIYYAGPATDTIKIGMQRWYTAKAWHHSYDNSSTMNFADSTLKIIVDTSCETNSPIEYFSERDEVVKDSALNYHSFLFTIQNISSSPLYMGSACDLYFIHREAKDKNGQWRKIDRKLKETGICTSGHPGLILKPHEIIIGKVKRYKGPMVTDFRLVFGWRNWQVYSNTFRDSIDPATFGLAENVRR